MQTPHDHDSPVFSRVVCIRNGAVQFRMLDLSATSVDSRNRHGDNIASGTIASLTAWAGYLSANLREMPVLLETREPGRSSWIPGIRAGALRLYQQEGNAG